MAVPYKPRSDVVTPDAIKLGPWALGPGASGVYIGQHHTPGAQPQSRQMSKIAGV